MGRDADRKAHKQQKRTIRALFRYVRPHFEYVGTFTPLDQILNSLEVEVSPRFMIWFKKEINYIKSKLYRKPQNVVKR